MSPLLPWSFATQIPFGPPPGFNQACANTASLYVVDVASLPYYAPATQWIHALAPGSLARWVGNDNPSGPDFPYPARSFLLCIPFTVATTSIGSASLNFKWAVDDRLGDPAGGPNTNGIYINKIPCCPPIVGGGMKTVSTEIRDVTSLVHTGSNTLYIYVRDTLDLATGIMFRAVIDVCPYTATFDTFTLRSGSVNYVPGGAVGTVTDALAWIGVTGQPLKSTKFASTVVSNCVTYPSADFKKCTQPTRVAGGPWVNPPGGGDALAKWINWGTPVTASSALVRMPFFINLGSITSANMTIGVAADDELGDPTGGPNTDGVYVNEQPMNITAPYPAYNAVTVASRSVPLKPGWNNLYVYARDLYGVAAGVFFSAAFTVVGGTPCSFTDPPGIVVAHSTGTNQLRVVFDSPIDRASAENTSNYALASLGNVTQAVIDVDGRSVLLTTQGGAANGQVQDVQVAGVMSADSTATMGSIESSSFIAGSQTIADIQAPDPSALIDSIPADRSRFAGTGANSPGLPVTFTGVCSGSALGYYGLMDTNGSTRRGILVASSDVDMSIGMSYRVTGRVMETQHQTFVVDCSDITEIGPGEDVTPVVEPVSVLRRNTLDVSQTLATGADYEGMLVGVTAVQVTRGLQNQCLWVKPRFGADSDTLQVCGIDSTFTSVPTVGSILNVFGLLVNRGGLFKIAARDRHDLEMIERAAKPPTLRPHVYPNPANPSVTVAFELQATTPVRVNIYDVRGALVRRLLDRTLVSGEHRVKWDGTNDAGLRVASGTYFYRITAASATSEGKLMILK
jgi:hypothetical protein